LKITCLKESPQQQFTVYYTAKNR